MDTETPHTRRAERTLLEINYRVEIEQRPESGEDGRLDNTEDSTDSSGYDCAHE